MRVQALGGGTISKCSVFVPRVWLTNHDSMSEPEDLVHSLDFSIPFIYIFLVDTKGVNPQCSNCACLTEVS